MVINVNVMKRALQENPEFVKRTLALLRKMLVFSMNQDIDYGTQKASRSAESLYFHTQTIRDAMDYAVREIFRMNREFCHGKLLLHFVDGKDLQQEYDLICDFEDASIKLYELLI